MKILAIGNSFSQDATAYLEAIAESAGEDLFVRNLFIGGCSLAMHAENIKTGAATYAYQKDGAGDEMISVADALMREDWDFVTVQQVSGFSGVLPSYDPHLSELLCFILNHLPEVRILLHRTWAYERGAEHPRFPLYSSDTDKMHAAILQATECVAKDYHLPIIPVGDAIQSAKDLPAFDVRQGGISLHRDGYHLSLDYGRYLAALVWFCFFTGKSPDTVTFVPDGTDASRIASLKDVAAAHLNAPGGKLI